MCNQVSDIDLCNTNRLLDLLQDTRDAFKADLWY